MYTPAYVDSETITLANEAQNSRVPVPFLDDPYVASQGLDEEGHGLGDEGHGLDDESQGLEDEGLGLEEEEAVSEGQQQTVPIVRTSMSEPLGLDYEALRHHELVVRED
nr:hypothetical protein [Tanacetum cinerariifolium]